MIKPGEVMSKLNRFVFSISLVGYKQCIPTKQFHTWEHSFHSIWIIAKGKGELIIDGTNYPVEPGKLFFLKPNMECERYSDSKEPLEYFFVRFTYAIAHVERENWKLEKGENVEFPLSGMYKLQNPPQVINLFEQIYYLRKRRGAIVAMKRKLLFNELLLTIIQDFRSQKVTGNTTNAIDTTIEYLISHYNEKITVHSLAQQAGMSVSHYSRLFKKFIGYSPMDYLRHVRMDRAKELIVLSEYKLKAIAQSVGYHDEFYFSRTFKKVVGMSPTEFAKRHRTKRVTKK
ncbi:AraC family transcriptional regulator [Evansella sp. AB-P1]|uniref:AraC family transcriptional regulator n=1 Tax=Evansella sp. AB-P1 TaxID=3037653 RepID=UPI00241EB486|nr:AraC family transcriptional regulator [Evansella sp. AB-P1]MDG5789546.1 AraC family transcriptional regulator [Evansella sp. AB-P1]